MSDTKQEGSPASQQSNPTRPARFWTLRDIRDAMLDAAAWMEWEIDLIEDFHRYGQQFNASAGSNVFEFALRDALRHRGMTLEQLRERRP